MKEPTLDWKVDCIPVFALNGVYVGMKKLWYGVMLISQPVFSVAVRFLYILDAVMRNHHLIPCPIG